MLTTWIGQRPSQWVGAVLLVRQKRGTHPNQPSTVCGSALVALDPAPWPLLELHGRGSA